MSMIYLFAIGATIAFGVSVVTVLVLRPHLVRLLAELCGSGARAGFWVVTSCLWMLVLGILAGTVSFGYGNEVRPSDHALFTGLVTQLRACLIGLLISLLAVAWVLLGVIRRFELGLSPAPLLEPDPMADPYCV